MTPLLYKKTGTNMALALVGEKIDRNRFTGEKIENSTFFNCDFSGADLSGTNLSAVSSMIVKARKGAILVVRC